MSRYILQPLRPTLHRLGLMMTLGMVCKGDSAAFPEIRLNSDRFTLGIEPRTWLIEGKPPVPVHQMGCRPLKGAIG